MSERPSDMRGINVLLYAINHAINNADDAFDRYDLAVSGNGEPA